MKIRRVFFTGFLFSLLSVSLSAQTAAMIENLLDEKAVKWSMAAAFVLDAMPRLWLLFLCAIIVHIV